LENKLLIRIEDNKAKIRECKIRGASEISARYKEIREELELVRSDIAAIKQEKTIAGE